MISQLKKIYRPVKLFVLCSVTIIGNTTGQGQVDLLWTPICQGNPDVIGTPEECTATSGDRDSIRKFSGAYFIHHTVTRMLRSPSARHPITRRDWNTIGRPAEHTPFTHALRLPSAHSPITGGTIRSRTPSHSFSLLFTPFHSLPENLR